MTLLKELIEKMAATQRQPRIQEFRGFVLVEGKGANSTSVSTQNRRKHSPSPQANYTHTHTHTLCKELQLLWFKHWPICALRADCTQRRIQCRSAGQRRLYFLRPFSSFNMATSSFQCSTVTSVPIPVRSPTPRFIVGGSAFDSGPCQDPWAASGLELLYLRKTITISFHCVVFVYMMVFFGKIDHGEGKRLCYCKLVATISVQGYSRNIHAHLSTHLSNFLQI